MNTFGNNFRVSIFGESHGNRIGTLIDGVPAGIPLSEEDLMPSILRRMAGAEGTTARRECDLPHIESGVYKGRTTGAPLTITFENKDVKSSDYEKYADIPRPGHADYTAKLRFGGFNDPRGGGHFSGRLTLPIVAAGVVAAKCIRKCCPEFKADARIIEIGALTDPSQWQEALDKVRKEGDSLGAVVECTANCPKGIGNPFWDSVESVISHAIFSIPGVRGIEFGDGFMASRMKGSEHNDPFAESGQMAKNGSGGVNGGITNGAPLVFRVAFKPTSSIAKAQNTYNFGAQQMASLQCGGRHDACFALRCPAVVEAMTAIALVNLIDYVKQKTEK